MKRTELRRTSELKPGKPLQRKTWMPRGKGFTRAIGETAQTVRKVAEKATGKAKRRTGPPAKVMRLLRERSGGLCELGIVCLGRAAATDPSHRMAKGMGGTKDPRSNTAANNLHSCRKCHDVVERDPAAAYANGWKIRRGIADPQDIPVRHWVHGWVYPGEDGSARPTAAEPERAECDIHPLSAAHPECGVCLLCGPCECELVSEWAQEVSG